MLLKFAVNSSSLSEDTNASSVRKVCMLKTGSTFPMVHSSDGISPASHVSTIVFGRHTVCLNVIIGIWCISLKRFGQITTGALIRGSYRV